MAQRPRNNPRRQRSSSSAAKWYILAGLLGAIALAGIFTLFYFRPTPIPKDETTLCPLSGPTAITAIIVDRTDSIGVTTKADIEQQIHNLINNLETGEELSLYEVNDTSSSQLEPTVLICSPQDPDEVNPLTGSIPIAQRRWAERFLEPVEAVLAELLSEQESPSSPILESIQSISISQFGDLNRQRIPRRLIVITDLLQNSDAISFYKGLPEFSRFQETRGGRGLNTDLRYIDIELWLVQRAHSAQGDGNKVARFFTQWVNANGGHVVRILVLTGMNT